MPSANSGVRLQNARTTERGLEPPTLMRRSRTSEYGPGVSASDSDAARPPKLQPGSGDILDALARLVGREALTALSRASVRPRRPQDLRRLLRSSADSLRLQPRLAVLAEAISRPRRRARRDASETARRRRRHPSPGRFQTPPPPPPLPLRSDRTGSRPRRGTSVRSYLAASGASSSRLRSPASRRRSPTSRRRRSS